MTRMIENIKQDEKEDLINDLPDHIICHILSFLPSTKEAIRTGILSKRWNNLWAQVPILIFNSTGMSSEKFLKSIDNTLILHDCSKINKFHLKYGNLDKNDPQFISKIRFATRKHVEDLYFSSINQQYILPKFLFSSDSLVQLRTVKCTFRPNGKVNWGCLTALTMKSCKLTDQAMDYIASGSPLLTSLKLRNCFGIKKLVIASKSLKVLVLRELRTNFDIEISCPMLEKLKLIRNLNVRTAKFLNLPCSLCATIDFYDDKVWHVESTVNDIQKSLIRDILQQLHHIKELKIGSWFIWGLSNLEPNRGLISPVLNVKCLTLNIHFLNKYSSGIVYILRNSTVLEKLVINVENYDQILNNDFEENHWNSNVDVFNCLVSHLKIIKIVGFPKRDDERKVVLNFVQFLLKNARVLAKIVIQFKDRRKVIPLEISQ